MTTTTDHPVMSANDDLITEYLAHLRRHSYPESTIDTYRSPLRRADRELPHGLEACIEDLDAWLAGCRRLSTRSTYRAALTGFYRWAVTHDHIDSNPAADLPHVAVRKRLPRPTTHEQTTLILTTARQPVRLWSALMAYAGLRCVEVARLRVPDDVTDQAIWICGKGSRERLVPTHPEIWAAVAELKPGLLAGGANRDRISSRCRREYARLGLPGVTPHRLRHWFGTHAQRATGDVRVTQRLMGHASVTVTEGYTLVSQDSMRAGVLGLPRLVEGPA